MIVQDVDQHDFIGAVFGRRREQPGAHGFGRPGHHPAAGAVPAERLDVARRAHALDGMLFGWSDNSAVTNKMTINGVDTEIVDAGWYGDTGLHGVDEFLHNYMVGTCSACVPEGGPEFYRNWFVIDLTEFTAPVTTLTLTLHSFDVSSPGSYTLWDYGHLITDLPLENTTRTDIYDDLGTGNTYGSFAYEIGDAQTYRTLTLNSDGRASLNAAILRGDDQWAIGGSFEPTAPIPEPETYALMLAGLGVVGWMARRRKA